jgi:c-di-GMP-binding flagellar brake protein YcgR
MEHRAKAILDEGTHPESLKPFMDVARWLDFKLDLILHRLRTQEIKKLLPHQSFSFDISGSGVSLEKGPEQEEGNDLILAITLPESPGRPVYARGEVLRIQDRTIKKQTCAAIQFRQISETDRERLIHYTFRQQRRELARRAGEADR